MSCKHLTQETVTMPPEIGGPPTPGASSTPACRLGRNPDIIGWATQCENTPHNGPCWFWITEYGAELSDNDFNHTV
jgi:hypothetical protein